MVTGSIQPGSNLTTGDSATIAGNALALGATTLCASSAVEGNRQSGAAVTLGASAQVAGTVQYGSTIANGAFATCGTHTQRATGAVLVDQRQGVLDAQSALDAMTGGEALATGNISTDTTLTAGIYDVHYTGCPRPRQGVYLQHRQLPDLRRGCEQRRRKRHSEHHSHVECDWKLRVHRRECRRHWEARCAPISGDSRATAAAMTPTPTR
jgi:hypothetical protein